MVIGKIKPTATIVAQFAAGVEIEAIQHEGKMFLPVVGMGEFTTKDDAPSHSAAPSKPAKEESSKEEKPAVESAKSYTKEELMDMDAKELKKICVNEFGIDPDEYEGKNTNKKLRDLILDAQKNGSKKDAPAAEEDDTNEEESDSENDESEGDLVDQVAEILEDFDAGKKNKKKSISAICALVDDADSDAVTELVEAFEDDADADLDEMAQKIADALQPKKEKAAAKKKRGSKKEKDEDLVSPEDLEVGDRVSVWWNDDNKDWFDGEVKSIKKGKITIAYDDDTEEVIDPEVHTKIKRLAE